MLQKSNTREMVFKIPDVIVFISSAVTLEPADVVARRPLHWLRPGDEMAVRVEGLGELRSHCVAKP